MAMLLVLSAQPLLAVMGTELTGAGPDAVAYLSIRALAAPAVLLTSSCLGILRGMSAPAHTPASYTCLCLVRPRSWARVVWQWCLLANLHRGKCHAE